MVTIKFKATRSGRRAYRYEYAFSRWMPLGLAEAELMVATGKAEDVTGQASVL